MTELEVPVEDTTNAEVTATENAETVAPEEPKRKRGGGGRTRPRHTIVRDNEVYAWLSVQRAEDGTLIPQTRKQIVDGTGRPDNEVYLSLYRLGRDGKIARTGAGVNAQWTITDGSEPYTVPNEAPAPTPTENAEPATEVVPTADAQEAPVSDDGDAVL